MSATDPTEFIPAAIAAGLATGLLEEQHGANDSDPYLTLCMDGQPDQSAGWLRLWRGRDAAQLDRMVYLHLAAGPVLTQLLFVFGRAASTFPHLHAQVVNFPPGGLVYNADLLPRVDPIDDFAWFDRVYTPLRRPYRKAVQDEANSCAQAPANPMLATLMSPWGIASQRTDAEEFARVEAQLNDYVAHYFSLASQPGWDASDPVAQQQRDARHIELFFSDELDPRAWNGVYRIVGESMGKQIKHTMTQPLT